MTTRIDWGQVDLTQPTDILLRELGCAESTLRRVRRLAGVKRTDKKSGGARQGCGRTKGIPNKTKKEYTSLSVHISKELLNKIRSYANNKNLSVSSTVVKILEEFIHGKA